MMSDTLTRFYWRQYRNGRAIVDLLVARVLTASKALRQAVAERKETYIT